LMVARVAHSRTSNKCAIILVLNPIHDLVDNTHILFFLM
jgi:hypothetical protein